MYKILKIGSREPLTIKDFVQLADNIDFSPVYQRYGNIWSPEKKKLLIDTVLNGFDIPKFYFNYFIEQNNILNQSNSIYAVIDGKQRLHALLDFVNEKFPLSQECNLYEFPDIRIAGLFYSQ